MARSFYSFDFAFDNILFVLHFLGVLFFFIILLSVNDSNITILKANFDLEEFKKIPYHIFLND